MPSEIVELEQELCSLWCPPPLQRGQSPTPENPTSDPGGTAGGTVNNLFLPDGTAAGWWVLGGTINNLFLPGRTTGWWVVGARWDCKQSVPARRDCSRVVGARWDCKQSVSARRDCRVVGGGCYVGL